MKGCEGFGAIDFEDAMQVARVAFAKALDAYDPAKGKISYFLLLKIRYELQKLEIFETHIMRAPKFKASERSDVSLVGEARELDLVAQADLGGLCDTDITPELVARWEASGEWPESEEAWRASMKAPTPPAPTLLERFLESLVWKPTARVPVVAVFNRWEALGGFDKRTPREELQRRGAKRSTTRFEWGRVPTFHGVTIRALEAA